MFPPGMSSGGGGGGGGGSGGGGSGGGGGSIRVKSEGGGGGMSHYAGGGGGDGGAERYEFAEPVYPDEEDDGPPAPRVDIEQINLISDDEDEDVRPGLSVAGASRNKGKGRATGGKGVGMRPIRLTRQEHKERVMLVNTDSSAQPDLDSKDGLKNPAFADDDDDGMFVPEDPVELRRQARLVHMYQGKRFPGDEDDDEPELDPYIKPDPGAIPADEMDLDNTPELSTPATVRRGSDIDLDDIPEAEATAKREFTIKRRKSSVIKDKKPVLQTEEDKAEYQRHLIDVQVLANELGGLQANLDADGDTDLDGAKDNKEGRLYLFQFPPILPPLHNPVKKDSAAENDDTVLPDVPEVDLDAPVAAEPNAAEEVVIDNNNGIFMVPQEIVSQEGHIGRLIVRESGKVELSWGGTSMALSRGADFDFLTTTVIMDGLEGESSGGTEGEEGERVMHATGMGRVMGKFVVHPDWEKLFEQ
jgi:DNA-directed RNA polymerase III subunit RPC4